MAVTGGSKLEHTTHTAQYRSSAILAVLGDHSRLGPALEPMVLSGLQGGLHAA